MLASRRVLHSTTVVFLALAGAVACKKSADTVAEPTGPLTVTALGPSGETTGPLQVFATFDKAVARLGEMADERAKGFLQIQPAVPGKSRFLGTQTVVFEPTGPVPRSSRFTVTVPTSARAVDGSGLAQPAVVEFTTLRLALVDTEPNANFSQAGQQQEFQLRFNQPVNPGDLESAVGFVAEEASAGGRIAARCKAAAKDAPEFSYLCKPAQPMPQATRMNLTVDASLHGAEGPVPMKEGFTVPFQVHGPLLVEGIRCEDNCRPELGARLTFSTPVVPNNVRAFINVTPPLTDEKAGDSDEPRWATATYATTTVYLPRLKPSTDYQVTVKAGLTDHFGQKLTEDKTFSFRTAPATPSARMPGGFLTMEPGNAFLPVRATNASKANVELWKVGPAEAPLLATQLGGRNNNTKPRAPDKKESLNLQGPQNQPVDKKIDLSSMLNNGNGLVAYRVTFPSVMAWSNHPLTVDGFVQNTPLAVTLKTWGAGSLAWVTELNSAKPVSGATVEFSGEDGQVLASAVTDDTGLAQGPPCPTKEGSRQTLWARVVRGGEIALGSSGFDDGLAPWDLGVEADWNDRGETVGLLVTDRGVYRPGETVHIKAIVRTLPGGELAVPSDRDATFTLTGPTGDEVVRRSVTLSALGTTHLSLPLDAGARLGTWSMMLMLDDESQPLYTAIQVEQFKAPDFKVEVTTTKAQAIKGEKIGATGKTLYLFGAPLTNARSSFTVSRIPTDFSPPFGQGFVFEDEARMLESQVMESRQIASGTATTGADGSITFQANVGAEVMHQPENDIFEVTTVDPSGQSVTGRASVLVHPGSFYLGLRTSSSMVSAGQAMTVDAVAVKPDGSAASASAKARLLRREYKAVKQQGLGDSMETLQTHEDVEVASCDLPGLSAQPRSCTLTPKQPGMHIVALEGKDGAGNPLRSAALAWVWGAGAAPWSTDETMKVNLVADKQSYQPGETARVLIQNPFPQAEALVTVERGSVLTRQVLHLDTSAPTLEFPIEEKYVPNVFVGVVLVRGRLGQGKPDQDRPAIRAGYVKLPVGVSSRRLDVSVTPDAAEHGPRDKVTVRVGLKDAKGQPTSGEVTLLAVDESVLQLTAYKTPDPLAAFYTSRGIAVRTADTRIHLVNARSYGEKGEAEGGGGLGALLGEEAVRGRFVTCAYFNPSIQVGPSGNAEVSFELPDNLTAFRLMALAVGSDHRFGSAQGEIRVKKPLMLRPAAPRVLRVGDQAEIGVVVVNATGNNANVELKAQNVSPNVVKMASESASVAVANGASVPVRFKVTASKPGVAILRVAAKQGRHSDSLEIRFPVTPVMPLVHDATYGEVKAGSRQQVPLAIPADARPDSGGLTLQLSSSLLSELSNVALQLHGYPYECAEQTASRILPLIELGGLRAAFAPSLATNKELADAAKSGLQKLLRFQDDAGAVSFWPGGTGDTWLTAYTLLVLHRAGEARFEVPGQAMARMLAFLKKQLNEVKGNGAPLLDDSTAVFVTDVLATVGNEVPAHVSRLNDKRAQLSLESRALLAHAAALGEVPSLRAPMKDDLLSHVHQSAKGATVQASTQESDVFGSPVRTHAMVLRALVALDPKHPLVEKLAVGLLAARNNGRYRTTQEAAWALMALKDYQTARETSEVNVKTAALLGGRTVTEASFTHRTLEVKVDTFPLADARKSPLEVSAIGTGSVRYGATLSYALATLPTQPLERGMFIQRTLATADAKPIQDRVDQGVLLRLTVEIATPMDRNQVAVDVPVPAGLELVNARFANAETLPPIRETPVPTEGMEDGEAPSLDPLLQGHFDHVELRDDRLLLFAERLPRGVHRYILGVRVMTPGTYSFAPARVEEMYTPEVFGMTAGSAFVVASQPATR